MNQSLAVILRLQCTFCCSDPQRGENPHIVRLSSSFHPKVTVDNEAATGGKSLDSLFTVGERAGGGDAAGSVGVRRGTCEKFSRGIKQVETSRVLIRLAANCTCSITPTARRAARVTGKLGRSFDLLFHKL